jgi:hypothetical protein
MQNCCDKQKAMRHRKKRENRLSLSQPARLKDAAGRGADGPYAGGGAGTLDAAVEWKRVQLG